MKTLWWQTAGTGNCHLVLLHGWGLNAEVWHCISEELASHFTLHLVDLPGFGRSRGFGAMSLDEMARQVLDAAPQNAIWLGWSLGGLVASQIALSQPERVKALVTVASSPCFSAQETWPGIKPDVLASFPATAERRFPADRRALPRPADDGHRNRASGCENAEADRAFPADAGGGGA